MDPVATLLIIVWLVAAVSLLLGVIGMVNGLYWLWKSRRSRNWPTAPGTIVMSQLITKTDANLTEIRDLLTTTTYGAKIRYSYTVAGRSLKGGRVGWTAGRLARTDHDARKRMTKYPVGQQVTVYYQPDNPENAVLETAAEGLVTRGLLTATFLVIGAALIYMMTM
jgi:hypothetical protein